MKREASGYRLDTLVLVIILTGVLSSVIFPMWAESSDPTGASVIDTPAKFAAFDRKLSAQEADISRHGRHTLH